MLAAAGSLAAAIWAALHLRTLLLAAVAFLFLADYFKNRRPKNYPPGPMRLPFVGCLLYLDLKQPHIAVQKFVKKYGNILSWEFANIPSVVVTGMPLIKEVFTQLEPNFLNRPVTCLRKHLFKNNGLIFSSGQTWKEQRRFALMTLRNFGLGKKSLEQCIQEESRHLVEAIREERGQPFDPHFNINNAVSNIICSVTFGERFEYQDSQFQEMLRLLDEAICLESSVMCQLYNIFPRILHYLPGSHQTVFRNWEKLKLFVSDIVDNHRKDWDPDEPRDFIDAFLKEMTKTTLASNSQRSACLSLSLFFFKINRISCFLSEKVQAEIDKVIGQGRQPSLADRESMPYTNAVIHEVQRIGNIIPFNVPREGAVNTKLAGFDLPKGIMILTNLTALHRDPKEWATPDEFNPEHFLENGQFKKRESFLPFSMGKRACLGEQLARSELFIFITSLIQKFTFKPPVNEKLSLQFRMSVTVSPVSHRICAIPRL
uniref:Cytochrome P450, family 2, subfamily j, polypeptide 9 n=1 Tax=Peromyscus maniculatus bairdii TaxID=230844 RepID=A0A8C8TMV3_PERMB